MVEESLHRLFELDVRLSSEEDLAHLGNVVLQEVFIQGLSNLQAADECENNDLFTAIRDFSKLTLKEVDVGFEIIFLPHLDGEKVMVILLGILARCVLGKKHFDHLCKVAERVW